MHRAVTRKTAPSKAQLQILNQMVRGIWYVESEPKERQYASCNALVNKGWLKVAVIAEKTEDGCLKPVSAQTRLFIAIFGYLQKKYGKIEDQPFTMYSLM